MSTGNVLPGIVNVGTPPKKSENFLAFIVAEVMMILRSRLWAATFFSKPKRTSVFRDRSCASSIIIALYSSNNSSFRDSRNNTPSVMYLMIVLSEVQSSNLMAYPTSWPNSTSISSATLFATDTAATLLGCVQPITPLYAYPTSLRYWVSWVVLPEPVSPTMMTILLSLTTVSSSSLTWNTGRNSLCCFKVLLFAKSLTAWLFFFNADAYWLPDL
mmetsp:Transcript_16927/g.12103  ORF Transcript_16927/g.12103 Transcript_16927/m.12103 type:complete len:215 (-) Transcript_16927:973-1617(-)